MTDTPLLFSRREIHIFDLLHRIKIFKGEDGWRFPLDQFPKISGSHAGPIKEVLDWCFPTAVLESNSLGSIAGDPKGDYQQSVFRLPLRQSLDGSAAIYDDRFRKETDRRALIWEMVQEATRSAVFLKNVCRISFGILRNREPDWVTTITATASPAEFAEFLKQVAAQAKESASTSKRECAFDRTVTRLPTDLAGVAPESLKTWRFHVRHVARYDEPELTNLREKLHLNGERAVPWAAVAVPLDVHGCRIDGGETARWRVFLPLLQEGPSACLIHGAFFVGKNRHRTDFRTDGSDEGKRKTEWNKRLFEYAVLPLLQNLSADLPNLAPELLDKSPKDYLSLFPLATKHNGEATDLTEFARRCFSAGPWELHLKDIWGDPFDLLIGEDGEPIVVEMIAEGLLGYRERFRGLSSGSRFVSRALGEALSARVGPDRGIAFRWQPSFHVALRILCHEEAPKPADLERLIKIVITAENPQHLLKGAWAFQEAKSNKLLRFEPDELFLIEDETREPVFKNLIELGLEFGKTAWVKGSVGLPAISPEVRPLLPNLLKPDATAALELLRRLPADNKHDQIANAHKIKPVVAFLLKLPPGAIEGDLRLGILVRTQTSTIERRQAGVVLLRPRTASLEDEAFWEVCGRKVFAQIDPECVNELQKLLAVHPRCLEMLHASDCRVTLAQAKEAFELLHALRLSHPEMYSKLAVAMAETADHRPEVANRFATFLLETADANWSEMDNERHYTLLALPIHRRADGGFVSLVQPKDGDEKAVRLTFRLQSRDDIRDAPIATAGKTLLQTPKSNVKRFYRDRLELEEHGRVAVLKDVLRQIGDAELDNMALLRYLAAYYKQTLDERKQSQEPSDQADVSELQDLMARAKFVPALDWSWNSPGKTVEAWQIADHLAGQGWSAKLLAPLLSKLLNGNSVASIDREVRELLPRCYQLQSSGLRKIPELAITSESPDFSLPDRMRLYWDNRIDLPDAPVKRSQTAGQLPTPTWTGAAKLADSEFFRVIPDLPKGILRLLAPHAIDLESLTKTVGLRAQDLPKALTAFQVPEGTGSDIDNRMVAKFSEVWPTLNSDDRMHVLRYVGKQNLQDRLGDQAKSLDTVLVATRPPAWTRPEEIVSPDWVETKPPHVPLEKQAAAKGIDGEISNVWDAWCGIRTFGTVISQVMAGAGRDGIDRRNAADAVYNWLERVLPQTPSEEELQILSSRSWVFAERDGTVEFKPPSGVLLHPGEKILGARFWVPNSTLPGFCRRQSTNLKFPSSWAAIRENVKDIAECLAERAPINEEAAVSVYALVESLLEEAPTLHEYWQSLAARLPVYRLFREQERQVSSVQLFIGKEKDNEDLSSGLLCLKVRSPLPRGILGHYRSLGVGDCPTMAQVLAALSILRSEDPKIAKHSYGRLIETFLKLAKETELPLDPGALAGICILTCAATFKPISECYWDEDFGRQERVLPEHASLLIDNTDKITLALLEWLRERYTEVPVHLRAAGELELADDPQPLPETPEVSYLLSPWRQWLEQAACEGSFLQDELARLNLTFPPKNMKVVPVRRLRVRCRLQNVGTIEQSRDWSGPLAFAAKPDRLFVRIGKPDSEKQKFHDRFRSLDFAVAREIALLLGIGAVAGRLPPIVDQITATLERPSAVLKRLREDYHDNSLHQYRDQVADPVFAELFEEYQRTGQNTSRGKERRAELAQRMNVLLESGFVRARREQIKGYGYDEFSVFAELLQNAEDAYSQMLRLKMEPPQPCEILYRYTRDANGNRVLVVQHQGRAFNYWQHGSEQDHNFAKDVEGVLRSAGSFKPHSTTAADQTAGNASIGRFGLGFKSVFLLTDSPEIHSGAWHFRIKSGCLPEELPPPGDLPEQFTRIRLPLREDVSVLGKAERLLNLLPFLSMIRDVRFEPLEGDPARIQVGSEIILRGDNVAVEELTLVVKGLLNDSPIHLLRCRSQNHSGQLALLLNEMGIPVRWEEVFQQDVYVALPLQAKLSCGVAVSHRFEVQSGRTHLVDPAKNVEKMNQVANLLEALVDALLSQRRKDVSPSELLRRLWALWKWNESDSECEYLSRRFAQVLVELAERKAIVPTLEPASPAMLKDNLCIYFSQIPDRFRDAMLDAGVRIPIKEEPPCQVDRGSVVEAGFVAAYARACAFAGMQQSSWLCNVGWAQVSKAFRTSAYFAEKPDLLNCLASTLNPEQRLDTAKWLAVCEVLTASRSGAAAERQVPGSLIEQTFEDIELLPERCLPRVSPQYDDVAIELLRLAGLRNRPSSEEILNCIHLEDLTTDEAVGILRYLGGKRRFSEMYNGIQASFNESWFPAVGRQIGLREAFAKGLVPGEVVADDLFKTWLGLLSSEDLREAENKTDEDETPQLLDPKEVLEKLYIWWQKNGASWTSDYESRLYGNGPRPRLVPFDERKSDHRRSWLVLFVIGCLHKLGRTRVEQHRGFIQRCEQNGWLDVFADGDRDAQRWMRVLNEYLDDPSEDDQYRQWVRQFVDIYQISRWLTDYVESFLNIDRLQRQFALDEILAPRTNPDFSGGGPDARSLRRTLGIGACFVMRELSRAGVITDAWAYRYCYLPTGRVRTLLGLLGCKSLEGEDRAVQSAIIHSFMVEHLGLKKSTFGRCFDLPLQALAQEKNLQRDLLGREMANEEQEGVIFRTHPAGYVYPIKL